MKSKDQRRFERYERLCAKLAALEDVELLICLSLIGWDRILTIVEKVSAS